jgi:hypothetical protein
MSTTLYIERLGTINCTIKKVNLHNPAELKKKRTKVEKMTGQYLTLINPAYYFRNYSQTCKQRSSKLAFNEHGLCRQVCFIVPFNQ